MAGKGKGTECKHTYKISSGKSCIENGNREKAFYNEKGVFRDAQRNDLYTFHDKFLTLRTKVYIKQMDGNLAATIKRAGLLSLSLYDWKIKVPDEPNMVANRSTILDRITIKSEGKRIAKVSNKGCWNNYKVEIEPGQNDALILAVTSVLTVKYVSIDMSRDELAQTLEINRRANSKI